MADKLQLPDDKDLAKQMMASQSDRQNRLDSMGWIGRLFGDEKEKPGNIAAIAIAGSLVAILVIASLPQNPELPRKELLTLFGGIVTTALGYIFGAQSRRRQ